MKFNSIKNKVLFLLMILAFALKAAGSDSLQVKPTKNQFGIEFFKPLIMYARGNGAPLEMVYTRNFHSNLDFRTTINYTRINDRYAENYGNGGCIKVGVDFNSFKKNPYVRLIFGSSVYASYYKESEKQYSYPMMNVPRSYRPETFNAGLEEAFRLWWRILPGVNGEVTGRANINLISKYSRINSYIPGVGDGWDDPKILPGLEFKLLFDF